ncbi:MAG: c-type cytochrome [Caldilineaceae bacterium]|nr:c-type cytochrome [Caldilineaceae bacterium]
MSLYFLPLLRHFTLRPLRRYLLPSRAWIIISFAVVSLLAVNAQDSRAQAPTPPPFVPEEVPVPSSPPSAFLGASLFQENCAPCHGPTGNSDGPTSSTLPAPPPRFADPATVWERSPAALFHTAKFGNMPALMPPWLNRLSDEQIWQAVFYAWSLHIDEQQVTAGQTLYAESCAACHGESGRGDGPDAESTLFDFTDRAAMNLRTPAELDAAWRAAHADLGADWSVDQRRDVLEYVRTFSYSPPWESPYRSGNGAVKGRVVQATAGITGVSESTVALTAYMNFVPVATFTATTAADGSFAFTGLSTDPNVVYFGGASYENVTYGVDMLRLTEITPTLQLEIPVYSTTGDGSGLRINRANWIIDDQPGALSVGVIMNVGNSLDRTFTGSMVDGVDVPVTVAIPLPEGAIHIEFQDGALGGRYRQVGNMLYDTSPIRPGQETRQIFVSYVLPYSGNTASLTGAFDYPVGNLNLLVADLPGLEVEVDAPMEAVGNQTIQDVPYRVWNARDLDQPAIGVRLRNVIAEGDVDPRTLPGQGQPAGGAVAPPLPAATTAPMEPLIPLAMGLIVVLILVAGVVWPLRRRSRAGEQAALVAERERLLTAIAELDDRRNRGELDDEAWANQRAALKASLIGVTREMNAARKAKNK